MELHRCMGCMAMTENEICEKCGWSDGRTNEPHQLPVGYVLHGQYRIGRVLGQGGFGITYLGWDDFLEIPVAIKEFFPNSMVNRECSMTTKVHCYTEQVTPQYVMSKERFLREAKALARFEDEPAIVRIRNFFQENDTAYIVMEYVRGTNLATYVNIRGGKLSPEETFRILRPIMEALDTVHKADLVHRDISPDNIMLHPRGGAKLLDFGAVRTVEGAEAGKELARSTEAILKHGFAPMEQYRSRGDLGPWTDEYALCATIWYCLTGRIPEEAPARMLEEVDIDWNIPGLLPHQQAALKKGMALRAKDRFGTIRELIDALFNESAPISVEFPVFPVPVPEAPKPPKPPKQRPEKVPKPPKQKPEKAPKAPKQKTEKPAKSASGRKYLWLIPAVAAVLLVAVFFMLPNGWKKDDAGNYRYYDRGIIRKDAWVQRGDLWYHVDAEGIMDTEWVSVNGARYYFGTDGVRVTQWRDIGNGKYYFGTDGVVVTGLRKIDGDTYFFLEDGTMATGWQTVDGASHFFAEDGKQVTGWIRNGRKVQYLAPDGRLAIGWHEIDGNTYWFDGKGEMKTGKSVVSGDVYLFGSDGVMQTGWQSIDGYWHYFETDGKMAISWHSVDGVGYYFDMTGRMVTGWKVIGVFKYYFGQDGAMHVGWHTINGHRFYFSSTGAMQTGWKNIEGKTYYFEANGQMVTGGRSIDGRWYSFDNNGVLQ